MAKSKSGNRGLSPWQNDQSKPSQSGFENVPSNIYRSINFLNANVDEILAFLKSGHCRFQTWPLWAETGLHHSAGAVGTQPAARRTLIPPGWKSLGRCSSPKEILKLQ
jgi:hypothetical protein